MRAPKREEVKTVLDLGALRADTPLQRHWPMPVALWP